MPEDKVEIFLGIDPGYADMGYGLVVRGGGRGERCLTYGSIKTEAGEDAAVRLCKLQDQLELLIRTYRPTSAAVERLFFSKNVKTAIGVAEARGVILSSLEGMEVPIREFNPAEVKMAVCGHGRAGKMEVQKMVQMLLKLDAIPKPDDAADALALALTLANTRIDVKQLA
ncbi:MAG: crossover junction endodeoxyribonuclease RuvC [Patescibacteria group bacterium]|nr:crossover junction endodeoxyribonuclease RuvC [Patescibacteria group bacterium]